MSNNKRIAVIGNGSWATALAKIVLSTCSQINWFIRHQDVIDEFKVKGKNPSYLNNILFDTSRINFYANINKVVTDSDILILAVPSPYVKQTLNKLRKPLAGKVIISAVKGMIPEENQTVTTYLHNRYNVPLENLSFITGPCHAEEIALERLSYLTIGSESIENATELARLFDTVYVHTTPSTDILGLEYSAVMKNIYAIAAGICQSLRYGDNFQAVLISNAIQEIQRFLNAVSDRQRNICATGYLGDALVTSYSKFSRNRQFGQMIGMGYSVKAAQLEMQMIAEGFYGTKCIYLANEPLGIFLPIVEAMYNILYKHYSPTIVIQELTSKLS